MLHYSGILLETIDKTLLLQRRDDKPEIVNPGMITTFGGVNEEGESPRNGAIRELLEESNLSVKEEDLTFFNNFTKVEEDGRKTELHIFILKGVRTEGLEIYEGKGYFEISKDMDLKPLSLSQIAKEIVQVYFENN